MYEPPAVDPVQYTERIWRQFDAVLTWNRYLTESSSAFTFEAGAYYDLPYSSDYGVTPDFRPPDPRSRERAICQICGDKYSLASEQLYSERRRVARWFHAHARTRMDVFGKPPMKTANYQGVCANKKLTLSRYRYGLCFENTFHPLWTKGYITEKILDCMASGTIPVYYGCSDVERIVPSACFIDYRQYGCLRDLDDYLQTMSDQEYSERVACGYAFLKQYDATRKHSVYRLYEAVAMLKDRQSEKRMPVRDYPSDYWETSSFDGRLRFLAMCVALPHYRFIDRVFSGIRLLTRQDEQ